MRRSSSNAPLALPRADLRIQVARVAPLVVLVVAALVLLSCTPVPKDSGIRGIVTIGPISPVEQQGQPNETPYAAKLVVKTSSGKTVARFESGDDGRFQVNVAPGTYTIESQTSGGLPFLKPQSVTVEAHAFAQITVPFDSGIR